LLDVTTQRHSQYARINQWKQYEGGRSMFELSAALRVGKWCPVLFIKNHGIK